LGDICHAQRRENGTRALAPRETTSRLIRRGVELNPLMRGDSLRVLLRGGMCGRLAALAVIDSDDSEGKWGYAANGVI